MTILNDREGLTMTEKAVRRKKPFWAKLKQYWPLYAMLIPGLIYLIINNYLPMAGLTIAFKKVNYAVGIFNSPRP